MSGSERPQVGVCVVKVEAQADHVLITVTVNRNLDRNLYAARSEHTQQVAHPEAAMDLVAQFLRHFL